MSRSRSRDFSLSSRASWMWLAAWISGAPPDGPARTEAGPKRTLNGSIVVASNASGNPYSPASVVRTATAAWPLRLSEFGKPPGWMLIATGTMQSTVTVAAAALLDGSGSMSSESASAIELGNPKVASPGVPQVIVNVSSMVLGSPVATASAVSEDIVGVTDEPAGAVAKRDTATSTGDDGPRFATTLRSVSWTGSPITTAVGGERATKLTMARSAFAFTSVVAAALLFVGFGSSWKPETVASFTMLFGPPFAWTRSAGRSTVTVMLVSLPALSGFTLQVSVPAGDSMHGTELATKTV